MRWGRNFTIQQTIVTTITVLVTIFLLISVILIYNVGAETNRELVYNQAREINKQIVLNYENYTNRVKHITNLFQKKILEIDIEDGIDELLDLFIASEELEEDIVSITLFNTMGDVVVSTKEVVATNKEIAVKEWYKETLYDNNFLHFSSPHSQDIFENSIEEVISASKVIQYKKGGVDYEGVLLIDMSFEGLEALSKLTNLGEEGHILILDADDNIVYSSDKEKYNCDSKSYQLVNESIFGSSNVIIDGVHMAMNINTISSTRWRIATFQNTSSIEQGLQSALYSVSVLILITMIITFLVAYLVARQITNPLKKLNKAIKKFHKGNFYSKVTVEGQQEIKIVTKAFNEMIDRIQELMVEVVKEQESKRQTELTALQNQINPHFLYNTLDCIIWLAEEERNDELVETVDALSDYFRVSLSKGKQFIPVREELRHIKSYMLIQQMRYHNSFTYEISCQEELKDIKIMKLILQPLVENAIYHGIDKDDKHSYININIEKNQEYFILRVINSGYGISEEKISNIYSLMNSETNKSSVGMRNVYKRIKLFYGEDAKLIIESELDECTSVSIHIPISVLISN